VAPGEYTVLVTVDNGTAALAHVSLVGVYVQLDLTLSTTSTARGQIRFDSTELPSDVRPSDVRIEFQPAEGSPFIRTLAGVEVVGPDWTFAVPGILGSQLLRPVLARRTGWGLGSVFHNGIDVTDTPIAFSGADVEDIEIRLTQRITEVTGTVADRQGAPALDATVVMFADDPQRWGVWSRFVAAARPDHEGRYAIRGLPPARYVLVAVDALEEGEETNPELLTKLRRDGTIVTLAEGASHTQGLTVSQLP
jgi:hypothetical protein